MTTFENLCAEVAESVKNDLRNEENVDLILSVFNEFQESERNGVDYIFDIERADDLICCIKGGLTAEEIATLVQKEVRYFCFGENYKEATPIKGSVSQKLIGVVEDFVPFVLLYVARGNGSYSIFYEKYVTEPNYYHF